MGFYLVLKISYLNFYFSNTGLQNLKHEKEVLTERAGLNKENRSLIVDNFVIIAFLRWENCGEIIL